MRSFRHLTDQISCFTNQTKNKERGDLSGGEECAGIEVIGGGDERLGGGNKHPGGGNKHLGGGGGGGGGDELRGGIQRRVSEIWSSLLGMF